VTWIQQIKSLAELLQTLLDKRNKEDFRKLQPVKSEMNMKLGMALNDRNGDKR